jgi:3-hydroxybutyryl-CoA dehydratase
MSTGSIPATSRSTGSLQPPDSSETSLQLEASRNARLDRDWSYERLRMSQLLYFEHLHVGDIWTSPRRTITETDIVNFAGMTGDYDPLHMDHEFARQTPYRRPIAHGLLGLSLVAGLASNAPQVRTLAFVSIQHWEFRQPMFVGDTVHALTEVLEKRPGGRRCGNVIWKRQLVNQSESVIQSGIFETLVALAQPATGKRSTPPSNPSAFRGSTSPDSGHS